ncbi:(R)-2-octanol dehydrogenase [Spathaspora passalidarum NRRL Y-27907]|uniref:(R)-2-octanol dehydrogenase n=1 Tax=Spathaspora passalidarum (strain NRRL Y-27907 / 11-Y1) TaxID=619300 RepID=G3AE15_SPAPN|nr:(R)-2-octanol dehydrogenase [Spathaspora passalidarum NRRL Y-27907]EGW35549.1 (R)-2-octanol dehydrogenase [Spathaspora passalidarum NRRL Y-27907]
MSYNFANKIAIVTGGLSGIGLSTTIKLLQLGAKVVIGDITAENKVDSILNTIKKASPSNHDIRYLHTDVASFDANKDLVDLTLDEYKGLDFVVANAGMISSSKPGADQTWEEFKRVIDVNLNGVFALNKLAINYWEEFGKKGNIVNVGSILSFVGNPGLANYCSSKGGLKLLTQTLAIEYGKKGIRVNSVNPAYIKTPLLDILDRKVYDELVLRHPIGRLGEPEEIADAIAFLLSDNASFITGHSLLVDGGYTAQ